MAHGNVMCSLVPERANKTQFIGKRKPYLELHCYIYVSPWTLVANNATNHLEIKMPSEMEVAPPEAISGRIYIYVLLEVLGPSGPDF